MRRIVFTALLFLAIASCAYRPTYVERPPIAPGPGSRPEVQPVPGRGGQQLRACREISRTRCETATCKGNGFDLVTLNCSGEKLTRCELGKSGC
ncbi:MAG TPA: hypothetical protein VNI54_15160 [Thermoanaerobaculia bacterium]|nr:hypothetical protein [Thermoanaerobaculia bacterium]